MEERRNPSLGKYVLLLAGLTFLGIISYWLYQNFSRKPPAPALESKNRLVIPALLQDSDPAPDKAAFQITAGQGTTAFLPGKAAATLGYNGSYLGPVIRLKRGEEVTINVENELREATTVHWHGLIVDGEDDGGPHHGIQPGATWSPVFTVDQPAATLWFHPHLMGNTSDQVYQGLAGLIYIEDEVSDSLQLPKEYGVDDIPLIMQDRNFKPNGTLDYQVDMMGVVPGDTMLVNGVIEPFYEVTAQRLRMRLLNASNSQNFSFTLSDGSPFQIIASDGGLLEEAYSMEKLRLAPGERAEIVADFSLRAGQTIYLMAGSRNVLEFRVAKNPTVNSTVPDKLAAMEAPDPASAVKERQFVLQSMGISGTINGKAFDMERIDEEVSLMEPEIWVITTAQGMMMSGGHPFHVHGVSFRILSRNGKPPAIQERGWKDTIFVDTGEEVRILLNFTKPGIFMYHCHILEHEDNGMMGQIQVQ